ncbi:MAG TPA: carboxypeptidase-like regulatory domain-containing protein, partial [Anaerolineae bacterium]|nr:carboxypeptidase-like regulatory domain-containing protein [Anaerolineae bacterium]
MMTTTAMKSRRIVWLLIVGMALLGIIWFWPGRWAIPANGAAAGLPALGVTDEGAAVGADEGTVEGTVMEQGGGPVEGAIVRLQLTTNSTTTGADGTYTLEGLPEGVQVTLTAWHEGYIVGSTRVVPSRTGVVITMNPHYSEDNASYQWFSSNDPNHAMSCMHCMVAWPQWRPNAHANSATSPRFFSVYNGTSVTDPAVSAPGYKLDFPDTPGNCANCHAPAAVVPGIATPIEGTTTITGSISADMNEVTGVEAEGSFCEFCHKIGEVYLDPVTGLPYDDKPGVLSTRLYRSPPGHVLWFGPFDDVA